MFAEAKKIDCFGIRVNLDNSLCHDLKKCSFGGFQHDQYKPLLWLNIFIMHITYSSESLQRS